MKTLKDFIKESQEINEGLFGDIVRKLLDTGLSWIGSSAKFIADQAVNVTSEIWKTNKEAFINVYKDFRRSHPEYSDILPSRISSPQDMASAYTAFFYNPRTTATEKIDFAYKIINSIKSRTAEEQISKIAADCYLGICSNPNVSSEDKKLAEDFLNDIISKTNSEVKQLIEERIKKFKAKVK